MKILLTGAAGFLGSHLSNRLVEFGHNVIGLDDLYTGSINNLRSLQNNRNFEFVLQDVRNPLDFEVDSIINFACPASPIHYQKDPVRTIETNFLGAINVLHLAKKLNCRVIQASTSEVYGDPLVSPQTEEYWGNVNPIGLRSCYDEGKRAAETLFFDYKRQFGIDSRVIRIFNTYGPNMALDDGRVISNFIHQALLGKDLTIYGDGLQTRSFCYVSDLIDAVMKLLEHKELIDSPINIGNPTEYSMIDIANLIIEMTESVSKTKFLPLPSDDPRQRKPNIALANRILDWYPKVSLNEGIAKTIDYFRKVLT
jgi:UDP-glucuronate decarboxylase